MQLFTAGQKREATTIQCEMCFYIILLGSLLSLQGSKELQESKRMPLEWGKLNTTQDKLSLLENQDWPEGV